MSPDYNEADIPRRVHDPDPVRAMTNSWLERDQRIQGMERGSSLRNAAITGGSGLQLLDSDGSLRLWLRPGPTGGVVEAFNQAGEPVVRMGRMFATGPESYGIEVKTSGGWVQLGAQSVHWNNIAGKPATFPNGSHTHSGADISSPVATAAWADNAGSAGNATGSAYAFNNNVGGSTTYQVWVGNNAGNTLGRNTSSRRYKKNIRAYTFADPEGVLALQPVIFDRRPTYQPPTTGYGPAKEVPGPSDEVGLIAEEVVKTVPEIVTYYDGQIDGVRYDLLGLALLPIVKEQADQIRLMESRLKELAAEVRQIKEGPA